MSFDGQMQPWYSTDQPRDSDEPRHLHSWEDAYANPRTGRVEYNEVPVLDLTACRGNYVDWSEHGIKFRAKHENRQG